MNRKLLWLAFLLSSLAALAHQSQVPQGLPESIWKEVLDKSGVPAGRYTLVHSWSAVSEASHLTGRAVNDPLATDQRAWEASERHAAPGRAMVYGPYREVPEGLYVAFVRIRLLEDPSGENVAELDAAVGYGRVVCASRGLTGADLAKGRYVQVPIAFQCPGGNLEIRLHWTGYAGLRVDRIALFRLDGGQLPPPRRAPEAVPSGAPSDLELSTERRPYPEVFPRSNPPAQTLQVCDVSRQPADVQLAVFVLQGLVNRSKPVIYCLHSDMDARWLNWLRRNGWVKDARVVDAWTSLLQSHRSRIKGIVITDPALPATKNVATMIAAVRNCLVLSPRLHARLSSSGLLKGLPLHMDLRGRWRTSVEAYEWAFENLWPSLNRHLAACSYPDHLALRDYLVQHKAFIFWISGPIDGARPYADPTAEARFAEKLLAAMPPNTPIMSYPWAGKDVGIGEGPGVTLFAEFGKYLVGSIDCANLSVHSGIRVPDLRPRSVPPPKLDRGKVYLAFIMSDGDNLPVLTVSNFPQFWSSRERGRVPIGWTISPSAGLLIPGILSYYYRTATPNDAFLAAVSGVGYTYPDSYALRYKAELRAQVFDGFLEQTERYMRMTGLRSIWIMNATRPEVIRRYADKISTLEALFPDYGKRVQSYDDATYPIVRNIPAFHAVTSWTEDATREQKIAQMVQEIRALTPGDRPAFLHVFLWNWGADLTVLPEVLQRLGPAYVAVRPDHLAAIYRQDLARRVLLVRAPEEVLGIPDRRLAIPLRLYNGGSTEMAAAISVTSGLRDARVEPGALTMPPGTPAETLVSGVPDGGEIVLLLDSPSGRKRYGIGLHSVPVAEGSALPEAVLQFVRRFEAEALPHGSGTAAFDQAASGRQVWRADRASARPGHVVFGPYAALPAGSYVAAFCLKGGEGEGVAGVIDISTETGKKTLVSRDVRFGELRSDEFVCFTLPFEHAGGPVETRLFWHGTGWLAMDWSALWRVVQER